MKLLAVLHALGEDIGQIVSSTDERDADLKRLDHVTDEVVAASDVLHPVMIHRVVSGVTRTLVVGGEVRWAVNVCEESRPEMSRRK